MKKIGFIGGYDKIDLIIYVAKVMTVLKKKVLIIDSTSVGKAKYIVPTITPTKMYVTEFEGIDIAIGFSNIEEIKQYLGISNEDEWEYDIVLVDTDRRKGIEEFELEYANKNYFVTSFDVYSLKKGLEALANVEKVIELTKVYFSKDMNKEDDDYLNFLSQDYKIVWNNEKLYFPFENGDLSVIYENQRFSKIMFRKLSVQYKDGIAYLVEDIIDGISDANIRRAMKNLEKGA